MSFPQRCYVVAFWGFDANEANAIRRLLRLSACRRPCYEYESAASSGRVRPDVAIVEGEWLHDDHIDALDRLRIPILIVSNHPGRFASTFVAPSTVCSKPIRPGTLLSALDRITTQFEESEAAASELRIADDDPTQHPSTATTKVESAHDAVQVVSAAAPTNRPGVGRALIVDDSATLRTQMVEAMNRLGFEAEPVDSGEAALARLTSLAGAADGARFDIIFLDVVMEGIDGYEVMKQLRQWHAQQPPPSTLPKVVLLTGRGSPLDRMRAALAGVDSFVTKPASIEAIRRVLSDLGFVCW